MKILNAFLCLLATPSVSEIVELNLKTNSLIYPMAVASAYNVWLTYGVLLYMDGVPFYKNPVVISHGILFSYLTAIGRYDRYIKKSN